MDLEQARFNMIEQQIRPWDVLDQSVLDIMRRIPRDRFVPQKQKRLAYADIEIPLEHGENMMHPRVEGRMLQELAIEMTDRCLEVGTGTGFVTACLAHLGKEVHSLDIHSDFTEAAQQRLMESHIDNVLLETKDVFSDFDTTLRYDVIAVTGSVPEYSTYFEELLNPGGRLFMVVGKPPVMHATLVIRNKDNQISRTALFETVLKPLHSITQTDNFVL